MKKLLFVLAALASLFSAPAYAATAAQAFIVSACGTLPSGLTYAASTYGIITMDTTGKLCDSATGGSGGTSATYGAAFPSTGTPSGGTDGTNFQPLVVDTTTHYLQVDVKAGGAGGGAVYGPTAVGTAAANPPVLTGGTADGTGTGAVGVWKIVSGVGYANIAQINGVTILTGAGAAGTGSARVAVGQDTTTIAGSAPGTSGTPSTNVISIQGTGTMTPIQVSQATAANLNATVVQGTATNLKSQVSIASGGVASGGFASGALASGSIAAGAQVDLLTMRGAVGAGTAPADALIGGAVYNSTPLTVGNTQSAAFQSDANGYLKVNIAAGGGSGGTSSSFGSAFPSTGTAIGLTNGTNMVPWSATSNYGAAPSAIAVPAVNAYVTGSVGIAQGVSYGSQTGSGVMCLSSTANPTTTTGDIWFVSCDPSTGGIRTAPMQSANAAAAFGSPATGASAGITSLVVKASAGNLSSFNCTAISGAAAGFCVAYNGTTAPSTGALTAANVLDFCYFGTTAAGCSLLHNGLKNYSAGIVILITSAATPYTYTTGTDTGAIEADAN